MSQVMRVREKPAILEVRHLYDLAMASLPLCMPQVVCQLLAPQCHLSEALLTS